MPDSPPEREGLDYQTIKRDLLNLFEATANLLEREWPQRYRHIDSARALFFLFIRIATNTYNTIVYICADTPSDPERKPVFALSVAPLTRTLFEQLIMLLFLLDDVENNVRLLFKTGYAERRRELDYCLNYHGASTEWQDWITSLQEQIALEESELELTTAELQHPESTIGYWPTPGKILKRLKRLNPVPTVVPFIEYVDAWLYRELSSQVHLSLSGMTHRGMCFSQDIARQAFGDEWEARIEQHLETYRVHQVNVAMTLMLAIVSEIEAHFSFGRNQAARYLWTMFSAHSVIGKDFWDARYSTLLPE